LLADDAAFEDNFGWAVAVDGNTAVVGIEGDGSSGTTPGAAYVFVRAGSTWSQQAKLTASDDANADQFGVSVAISGDSIIVGATLDDDSGSDSGSAYVFARNGSNWTQQAKLLASNGESVDVFGRSVSISGDTAIVSAVGNGPTGTVFVFVRSGEIWSEQQILSASDGESTDGFGWSAAIAGDTVIVGSRYDDDTGPNSGASYIYTRTGATWTETAKLLASDGNDNDWLGEAEVISGNTAIVGSVRHNASCCAGFQGAAYVYVRHGGTWSEQSILTASDKSGSDQFGASVAINGDKIVVGAFGTGHVGTNSGTAYIFNRTGTTWKQEPLITAFDAAADDYFGISVAVSANIVLVGSYRDDDTATSTGSVYVYAGSSTVASAPLGVTATAGDTQATVSWSPPASDGGAEISQYTVTGSPGGATASTTATTTIITGLTNGTSYTFTVRATNAEGPSGPSAPSNAVTPFAPPSDFTIPGTLSLDGVSSSTAFALIGPIVTLYPQGGGSSTVVAAASDGSFATLNVLERSYTITASSEGFLAAERQSVVVSGSNVIMPGVSLRGGEVTGDSTVSIRDISAIAASFGSSPSNRLDGEGRPVDVNGDGAVDIKDISTAASNFGASGPTVW
jgi:hypothetical protein